MDTSEKYIKMCEETKEIQEIRNGFSSDYSGEIWAIRKDKVLRLTHSKYYVGGAWLPRQDQLQEMIDWSAFTYVISTMVKQIDDFYNTLREVPKSMEQLWLAFVMKEKYNKHWDWKNNKWTK